MFGNQLRTHLNKSFTEPISKDLAANNAGESVISSNGRIRICLLEIGQPSFSD